jgi:hypothetical protein
MHFKKKEKVYFALKFQRFQSMVILPCCFGPVVTQYIKDLFKTGYYVLFFLILKMNLRKFLPSQIMPILGSII